MVLKSSTGAVFRQPASGQPGADVTVKNLGNQGAQNALDTFYTFAHHPGSGRATCSATEGR
jgi:hypothetical protein